MSEGIIALILIGCGIIVHYRALYLHYIIQKDDLLDTSWEKYFAKVSQPMQLFHMVLGPLVALLIIVGLFLSKPSGS